MVWFQCDDCGDNVKKPKLPNHFYVCSASKLSCIDCGTIFDRHSVQYHTQCVSEAQKYGPKSELGNNANGPSLPVKDVESKQNFSEIDLSMGLSARPPWTCSLCNVKASGREALDSHSHGKKHQSKVKAAVSRSSLGIPSNVSDPLKTDKNMQVKCSDEPDAAAPGIATDVRSQSTDVRFNKSVVEEGAVCVNVREQEDAKQKKKRKKNDGSSQQPEKGNCVGMVMPETEKSAVTTAEILKNEVNLNGNRPKVSEKKRRTEISISEIIIPKEQKPSEILSGGEYTEDLTTNLLKAIKWKKLIRKELQVHADRVMKKKKLKHRVLPLAQKAAASAGIVADVKLLELELMRQIRSSSKFCLEGNLVRLENSKNTAKAS
ncbi:hypothetical protein O6H91_22G024800 [Diphasiastrum complanatum]|uniref:Uncharacterized protein n=1 Tax=Diphasiastrum complanatum TaxID=34168 RepID=A0ACC2AF39_DIPCM|nr:hypothetical protein O6H91_22G024800 [Diphasiastrum complanatum]